MDIKRKPLQGVLNILSFNRHFYIIGLAILVILIGNFIIFQWSTTLLWIIIIAFIYGLIMPLIISAYVYDFSGYYNFKWLKYCKINKEGVKHIVNINAGFDETSFILEEHFSKSQIRVFDFYNAKEHTEPAIVRARKVSLVYPNTKQIETNTIPLADKSIDLIFLLSTAHEIRSNEEKIQFLKECYRICKPNGKVVMIEHLRDFSNFLAFSIGFTHFFSSKTWQNVYKASGFSSFTETKFTPFMSIFTYEP